MFGESNLMGILYLLIWYLIGLVICTGVSIHDYRISHTVTLGNLLELVVLTLVFSMVWPFFLLMFIDNILKSTTIRKVLDIRVKSNG